MPAKINHVAVVDGQSGSSTWQVLQILWPLLEKLLKGVEVMSIQNFKSRSAKNIPLKNDTLPAEPRRRADELIFFYGSTTTGGAAAAYERGEYRCVSVSLNPPTDSERILFEMWDLLEFLNPVGVFSGEEMGIYEYHIKAVESGRLTRSPYLCVKWQSFELTIQGSLRIAAKTDSALRLEQKELCFARQDSSYAAEDSDAASLPLSSCSQSPS